MSNEPALHSVFIFLWKRTMLKLVANNSPLSQPGFLCNQESGRTVVCWQIGSCYEDNEGIKLLCTPSPWKQQGSCRKRLPGFYLCMHVCVICEETSPRGLSAKAGWLQPLLPGKLSAVALTFWLCCEEVNTAKIHSPWKVFSSSSPHRDAPGCSMRACMGTRNLLVAWGQLFL